MPVKNILKMKNPHCVSNPHCPTMHLNGLPMGNPNANAGGHDLLKIAGYSFAAYAIYLAVTGQLDSRGSLDSSPTDFFVPTLL